MALFGEANYALIARAGRAIGPIIPHVVIEEVHRDGLIITQHPVEAGTSITDHAFKRPAEYEMRCGFSNSTAGYEGFARQVYQQLLTLQNGRQPQTIFTGKRVYRNMLLADVAVITDKHSENILAVQVRLQEIIIVSTKTTNTSGAKAGNGAPNGTGGTTDKGAQSGTTVNDQSFAGAANPGFNPGNFNTEGGTLPNGSFGDGLSPTGPEEIALPEQSVSPGTPGGSDSGSGYDIWEFG